jgi:hypothetical protein
MSDSTEIHLLVTYMNKRTSSTYDPIIMSLFDTGRSKLNVGKQTSASSEAI